MKRLFSVLVFVAAAFFTRQAAADTPQVCTVTAVGYANAYPLSSGNGNEFTVTCNETGSTVYLAYTTGNNCSNSLVVMGIDTVKIWLSAAQTALIAGRTLQLYWFAGPGTCGKLLTSVANN